jgi:hypothetical protein
MLAYLIERRLSGGKWQIVGWFASFRPAMSTACSLEPARLSVADLEAVPEVEPEAKPLATALRSRRDRQRAPGSG